MIPVLFAENSTTWSTNGIGRLSDAVSCKVTEERNGKYELEMVYPTTGIHFSDITIRKLIVVKPCQKDILQPFRIYKISRPIHGKVTVYAQHLSYDLTKYVALPFKVTASGSACATVLSRLKSNSVSSCPFTFQTDVTTVASYEQKVPASIRQRLGGIEGSVLDQFGGEYEWDGYTVRLLRQRGINSNYTLRYGKNITDVKQDENIANTATGVVPYWMDIAGDTVVYGNPVYSSHRSEYSTDLIIPLDLSEEWEEPPTQEQLQTLATVYVNKTGFGIPAVSIKVSFVNLADTEEFKDILPMQSLNLCDTVKVQFEELGIDTTAEVVETVFDVLADKYESIQIGSLKTTLASVITDSEASMAHAISETGERVFAQTGTEVKDLVDNATAWLTSGNGYVVAVKNNDGSWKELLFMDDDDMDQARNVLRINENGLGFSSSGVGGPYTQAWTLDGRLIIGGTNVPSLTCYDSGGNIIFQAARDGVIWNAANSSMTRTGKLTIKNASITGGTLTLGGEDNGKIIMKNDNDEEIGRWDKRRLRFKRGDHTIDLTADGSNAIIEFDEDSYIDGTGSGGQDGFHFNADNITFSVNDLHITKRRNGEYYTGYNGDVITGLSFDELSDVVCDLHETGGGGLSWTNMSFSYVNGYSTHEVISGIVGG